MLQGAFHTPMSPLDLSNACHALPLLHRQVVFLPGTAGNQGPPGKDANMGMPAQMFSRNDPSAEQPVEKQVGAGQGRQGAGWWWNRGVRSYSHFT